MMIRPWIGEDLPVLAEVEKECFSDPYSLNMLTEEFESPHTVYLVVEENGEILGYGGYSAVLDEADIMTIGIIPKARGLGLGQMLLEKLISHAKEQEIKKMWLEVRVSNLPAITLYKKLGFCEIGIRKEYYANNREDALTMMKEI